MSGGTRSLTLRVINVRKELQVRTPIQDKERVGQRRLTHRRVLSESPLLPSALLRLRSSSVDEVATRTKSRGRCRRELRALLLLGMWYSARFSSRHYQCPLMSAVLNRRPGLLYSASCSGDGGRSLV